MRKRYQHGTIERSSRKKGEDVWVFRFFDGGRRCSEIIGTVRQYPTKSLAEVAATPIRQRMAVRRDVATFSHLAERFRREAMPSRSQSSRSYESILKRLEERWGSTRLEDMAVSVVEIQQWIGSLQTLDGRFHLSKKYRANIKGLLHRMFDRAMAWNLMRREINAIDFVEVRNERLAKRQERPRRKSPLLTPEQFQLIVSDPELPEHVKVFCYAGAYLGLRASEILALRWEDFDSEAMTVHIQRSVVGRYTGETKTDDSESHLPLPDALWGILEAWRGKYPSVDGWVIGNPVTGAPYHRDALVRYHLKPAGLRAGVQSMGSHSFRHSYRAWMDEGELAIEWQKRLMRHSDVSMTLSYGEKRVSMGMREGNKRVVSIATGKAS